MTEMTEMNERNDQNDGFVAGLEPDLAVLFARLEMALRLQQGEVPGDLADRVLGALRLEREIESDPLAAGLSGALSVTDSAEVMGGVGGVSVPAGLSARLHEAVMSRGADELEREFELEFAGMNGGLCGALGETLGGALGAALRVEAPAGLSDRIAAATVGELVGAGVETDRGAVVGRIGGGAAWSGSSKWTGWFAAAAAVALLATVGWVTMQTGPAVDGPVVARGGGATEPGREMGVDQLAAQLTEFLGSESDEGGTVDPEMLAMSIELDEYAMNWEFLGGGSGSTFDDTAQVVNDLHILETSFGSY